MAQPDLGVCLRTFCTDFRSFALSLEKSCRDLRRTVSDKGPAFVEESHFTSLLGDLSSQVETVEAEVSSLERSTVDTISVAELLGHCNEMYLQNEAAIQQLEEHLQQYGYTPELNLFYDGAVELPQATRNANNDESNLAKPSPSTFSTPSWGSQREVSEQRQTNSGARPPLPSSNASTPATRDEEDFATPKKAEESTLELRRDILGRRAAQPVIPPEPGSPELLSLADLGLSASSLEAIKDESEANEPGPSVLPKDTTSNGRIGFGHLASHDSGLPLTTFQTPLHAESADASRQPPTTSAQLPDSSGRLDEKQSLPGISVRQREWRAPPSNGGGDSLFPLAEPVTQEEFDKVPLFLRAQVSLQDLNAAVQKINDSMTDKRFSEQGHDADCITVEDLAALSLGPRLKAYLLLLVRLDRLVRKHVAGATVYTLQAGSSKQ